MTYDKAGRRPHAAFRADNGDLWVSVFYENDLDEFTTEDGRTWRRVTDIYWEFPSRAKLVWDSHLLKEETV